MVTPIPDTSIPTKCNQILSGTINLSASSSNKEPSYPLGPIAPQFVVRPILSNPPPKFLPMGDDGLSTHSLRMEHWLRIFGYLKVKDLLACKSVCKTWNCWCYYAPLWKRMDVSRIKIKKVMIMIVDVIDYCRHFHLLFLFIYCYCNKNYISNLVISITGPSDRLG